MNKMMYLCKKNEKAIVLSTQIEITILNLSHYLNLGVPRQFENIKYEAKKLVEQLKELEVYVDSTKEIL